jgi:serine/threonine-protein kinase
MTTPSDDPRSAARQRGGLERHVSDAAPNGACIQGRYLVLEAIGRGGMAVIYRVTDLANQRQIALKQLVVDRAWQHYAASAASFEREFHTLAELSHPRVIEVYDYGLDERGPFYTMQLLDGGDLRTLSPLPWLVACSQIYDVCSSLALIHSRRLVHRDVSPGNVRCTRDGQAKLIDFGAMVPMGRGGLAVGTPQFVAPEVVHGSSLDARTDLFSLGATLYFALTGRSPYPARDFATLLAVWKNKPPPPSQYAPEIPAALDALVLALIAVEPAMRPRTAFEVMQRLAAIAGIEHAEPISVSRAYLATPVMLGRVAPMAAIRSAITTSFEGRGGCVLIRGVAGVGRSRILDACALTAKTLGAMVLRGAANAGAAGGFRVAASLAQQLEQSAPDTAWARARKVTAFDTLFEPDLEAPVGSDQNAPGRSKLRDFGANPANRFAIQTALSDWFLAMARKRPIVIAIDDFSHIDEPSAALLAALASRVEHRRLCIIVTAETGAEPRDRLAFEMLEKHSLQLALTPLAREDTQRLFESVFGDVPNVTIVSDGVHAIAAGNPRATLDLAQHLCDRGLVRYERGSWTLPARLESNDLPSSAEEAMRVRLAALSPLARWLAETQALATYQAFTREDYSTVRSDARASEIDRAMTELGAQQIVVSDGRLYTLAHRGWCAALEAPLGVADRAERHRALAALYEGRPGLGVVRHALLAGLEARALDQLAPLLATLPEASTVYEMTDLSPSEIAATFGSALSAAERTGRSKRELNELRRWLASLSVVSDDVYYQRAAPPWLERLKLDSGYVLWQQSELTDPQARLGDVMQRAFERHAATPEAERVYRPDEAIKGLAHYVGISLAIGVGRIDLDIVDSLPALLEPFAPLSGLIHAIWQNAIAARESACRAQPERARKRWLDVYERLAELDGIEPKFVGVFRRAVAHAIGSTEASMGVANATAWADCLDDDPVQRVNGLNLRRIVHMQQGDWDGA